ncbi:MAG: ABC transporter permease [Blastocatellia bacterium]|nr:ABC transporter permease [Blastocatellia bacterium]
MHKILTLISGENVRMALGNLRANKFRSFLTVLGIVIGVATVIAVASILTGLRGSIVSLVEQYGTNNIYAFHLTTGFSDGNYGEERTRKPLRLADAAAIEERAAAVEDVATVLFIGFVDDTLAYEGTNYKEGNLQAVTANYARAANLSLQEGRFFGQIDDQHKRNVMVVGSNVVEALFPFKSTVVGTQVKMSGKMYEIIGVLEKRKSTLFGSDGEDSAIYIPLGTGKKLSPGSEWMMFIIRARSGQIADALGQTREILRNQRGVKPSDPDNFDLSTADKMIGEFDSIFAMIGLIAIAVSGVGLLVGGIGVMNIMLVSVTERTAEIGIRKAIGAKRSDIVRQFLFEAMTLTFLGGVLGVVLAVCASWILMMFVPSLPAEVPMWAVTTALLSSAAIGIVFGVWPARKASRLDPIECLRYE